MALYSVLAIQDLVKKYVPKVTVIVCIAILAIAFLVGYVRGVRKVNWSWLLCLVALIAFASVHAFLLKENKRLALKAFGLDPQTLSNVVIAVACIMLSLIVYGLCSICFRPIRKKERRKRFVVKSKMRYGIDLGYDSDDYYVEDDYDEPKKLVWYNAGRPTVVGRCIGAVVCVFNTAVVLMVILATALLFIDGTALNNGFMGKLFEISYVEKARKIAATYAFDFLSIGIVILVAFKGFKHGLVGSIRSLVVIFGGIAVAVLAFYLPFSPYVEKIHFLKVCLERCSKAVKGLNDILEPAASKLLMGVCLFVVLSILLGLLNFILTKSCKAIRGAAPVRILDGSIACLLYVVVGVVIMIGMWCALSALEYCGLFKVSQVIDADAPLANGLLDLGGDLLRLLFDKIPYGDDVKTIIQKILVK